MGGIITVVSTIIFIGIFNLWFGILMGLLVFFLTLNRDD